MNGPVLKPSELKSILRSDGIKYYNWIGFLKDGKLLLENKINKKKVSGKILSAASEGELYIRLHLRHENINRLLEVLCVNDNFKILISPFIGNSIGNLIHYDSFNKNRNCFDRKKLYAKDILSALSYMHQNFVFHLSLSDENIAICSYTDKAILCDFSYVVAQEKVTKKLLPPNRFYLPPEVEDSKEVEEFDSLPIDIWDCGILLLQIFTQHQLPWKGALNASLEFLEDIEILKKTNSGANINEDIASEFRVFIQHLLSQNPDARPFAEEAMQSRFLRESDDISNSFIENGRLVEDLSASDVGVINLTDQDDIGNLTDLRCRSSVKPRLNRRNSYPDPMPVQKVSHSPLTYINSHLQPRNNDAESTNPKEKFPHLNYLSEWEVDNRLFTEDDLMGSPYSEELVLKDVEMSKYLSCSLEQIIPQIISLADLNPSVSLPNLHNSKSGVLSESYSQSEPTFYSTTRMDERSEMTLKNDKENQVSRKDNLDLSRRKSMPENLKSFDSSNHIDKSDLCENSEIGVTEDRQKIVRLNRQTKDQFRVHTISVSQKNKWYHKLCCGYKTKKAD